MKKFSSGYYFPILCKIESVLIILAVCISFSCSSPLYKPTVKNVGEGADLEELKAGRKTYIKKCSNCHTLFLPGKFDAEQWKVSMNKMEERSKLNAEERNLVLNYLLKGSKVVEKPGL